MHKEMFDEFERLRGIPYKSQEFYFDDDVDVDVNDNKNNDEDEDLFWNNSKMIRDENAKNIIKKMMRGLVENGQNKVTINKNSDNIYFDQNIKEKIDKETNNMFTFIEWDNVLEIFLKEKLKNVK